MDIVKQIESLGYIVELHKGTAIFEPFTSKIDGEIYNVKIAWSTRDEHFKFLEECLNTLKKSSNEEKPN